MDDHFEDLPAGTSFYRGLDENGGLKIFRPSFDCSSFRRSLSDAACMAIALTDICCEKGRGKFFVFAQTQELNEATSHVDAYTAFKELPDILYGIFVWSEKDRKEWRETTPCDKLILLTSRYGWIPDEMPVVPIALDFTLESHTWARLGGYTTVPVTILVSPQPFVGYTEDMRSACKPLELIKSQDNDYFTGAFFRGEWVDFQQFAVQTGCEGIVEKIQDLYDKAVERLRTEILARYDDVVAQLIKAGETAHAAGKGYGIQDDAVDFVKDGNFSDNTPEDNKAARQSFRILKGVRVY